LADKKWDFAFAGKFKRHKNATVVTII